MKFVERWIQSTQTQLSDKEIMEKEKKWDALEEKLGGFPKKRRYKPIFGKEASSTFVWEREWNSLAEMEAASAKYRQTPESAKMMDESPLAEQIHMELYYTLDD